MEFPATERSMVWRTRSEDAGERQRALETLASVYWRPVYHHVRAKWRQMPEDAGDLTQAFFARALEREFFQDYDAGKAAFRTYLRMCLDRFVSNELKAAARQKRSAGSPLLSLDIETAEGEFRQREIAAGETPEEIFQREWVRSVLARSLDTLRRECEGKGKLTCFRMFERYDLDDSDTRVTYQDLAAEHGVAVTDVTNYLAWCRREFRRVVLETLQELTATEREFRQEALAVLGREP